MTEVSFNTTVYNSIKWVRKSLLSLIDTSRILKSAFNVDSEIVVIDNFSNDGTYEELEQIKTEAEDIPIRISRYKCTRGLGRNIALHFSKGDNVVYVDLDTIYVSKLLADLIAKYLRNPLLLTKSLYLMIVPRKLSLKIGGFNDLNRTEDVEYCARLAKEKIILPIIDPENFSLEVKSSFEMYEFHLMQPKTQLFVQTYSSEKRYATNFFGYIKRECANKIDMICGLGLTPVKIVRELWFQKEIHGIHFLTTFFYQFIFLSFTVLMRRKRYSHSKYLSNNVLSDYTMILNYIELLKEATRLKLIDSDRATKYMHEILASEKARTIMQYVKRVTSYI